MEQILKKYKDGKYHLQEKAINDAKSKLISFNNEYYIELGNSLFLINIESEFVITAVKEWKKWNSKHLNMNRTFNICNNIKNNGAVLKIVHSIFLNNCILITKSKIITIIEYFLLYVKDNKKVDCENIAKKLNWIDKQGKLRMRIVLYLIILYFKYPIIDKDYKKINVKFDFILNKYKKPQIEIPDFSFFEKRINTHHVDEDMKILIFKKNLIKLFNFHE